MLRAFATGLLALLFSVGVVLGAQIEGTLKSVNAAKSVVTITIKDKDRDFVVTKDTKLVVQDSKPYVPETGLADKWFQRPGLIVRLRTEDKCGKEVVTEVVVFTGNKR